MQCAWVAALLVGLAGAARADTLTCDAYRSRLDEAWRAGQSSAMPPAFTLGFSDPVRGKRFGWDAGQGLEGNLSCGPQDQFQEFGIELRFDRRQAIATDMKRLVDMQAAAICALSGSTSPVCADYGRAMLREALQQMGGAFNKGVKTPTGLVDRTLFGPVKAELVSSATLVSFVVGPGRGNSVDDARPTLPDAKPTP